MSATNSLVRSFENALLEGAFDVALFSAASICDSFPASSDAIRLFRHAYRELVLVDADSNLLEFHEAVGVPLPTAQASTSQRTGGNRASKVDLIIPVHNGLEYLETCIVSLLVRPSSSISTVVIIDDGSDQDVRSFARALCGNDPRFVIVRMESSVGFTRAVEFGLRKCSSPFFVVLNSDTVVCENWLELLLSAMQDFPAVGLVGAVSNAAAWQNLAEPLDEDGNFLRHRLSGYGEFARVQRCAADAWAQGSLESPLVHGFCALVDRFAFDQVGGLDQVSFPRGYGEFQDLSIRLWDAGYRPRVATNCFIGHVGAGSLDLRDRGQLSISGRLKLYEKHTALRYLTFEAASIYSVPMQNFRLCFNERWLGACGAELSG